MKQKLGKVLSLSITMQATQTSVTALEENRRSESGKNNSFTVSKLPCRRGEVAMNRKRIAGIILAAAVLVSGFPSEVWEIQAGEQQNLVDVWDGTWDTSWYDGHENEKYYEITTAEQLAGMARLSADKEIGFGGKTIRLMADLDLAGIEWTPIGLNGANMPNGGAFCGVFEGNYHVIYNLKVTKGNRSGLFSSINGGTIQDLGIGDAVIVQGDTSLYHGILGAFTSNNIRITNCYTTGSIALTDDMASAGGLIGFIAGGGKITGCYSSAEIRSEKEIAFDGNVSSGIGGIVGSWNNSNLSASLISDCYFNGSVCNVTGSVLPAGILGVDYTNYQGTSGLTIKNCFVKPVSVSVPSAPDNFTYIGIFNGVGQLSDCYYMEPEEKSDETEKYLPALMLEKGDYDPFAEEDVKRLDTMAGLSFTRTLNGKANQSPRVTWVEGENHPTFSWDKRNTPASLDLTATSSDASKAFVTALSDMDGTVWYAVVEEGMTEPDNVTELEKIVAGQDGIAQGVFDVKAGKMVILTVEGLAADTRYGVIMAVKNHYNIWSGLTSEHFKTGRDALRGAVVLTGFPVVGETLETELIGAPEDADPVFIWYRGKTRISGEDGDSYTLSEENIGYAIHVEVDSPAYEGRLISNATPKIAEEYTVTKISVTKTPDRMVYGREESFDRTGMKVTAYLRASASNATPSTAQKVLADSEYDTDYDFSSPGRAKVKISYLGEETELEVTVTDKALEGEVAILGLPVVGESIKAELTGTQTNTDFHYTWYRDGLKIEGAAGSSYTIRLEDAGHRIRVEVTASRYGGKLVSDPTDTIQSGYVVSGIHVTKMPDKLSYKTREAFDGTGLEITADLKVNALAPTVTARRILKEEEYEVSYDFGRAGTEKVTIIYRWNGAAFTDVFEVEVKAVRSTGGSSGSSGKSKTASSGGSTGYKPQPGIWSQNEEGSWKFEKADGMFAVSEWVYTSNGGKNEWYHFDETGGLQSGWFAEGGKLYYLNTEHDGSFGAMGASWKLIDGDYWYYFNPLDGAMAVGWHLINGKWYYFNPAGSLSMPYGAMYANTGTPDGFQVGPDGAWIE